MKVSCRQPCDRRRSRPQPVLHLRPFLKRQWRKSRRGLSTSRRRPGPTGQWGRGVAWAKSVGADASACAQWTGDFAHRVGEKEATMEMRAFGRSGMRLSILGFGCGAVGGLMVRGDPADQERAVARALEVGVNYFDTAVQYGDGESEKNLGRILGKLKPANVVVGTKDRLPTADFGRIGDAIATSLDASLARLRLARVDIFHLHNAVTATGG